MSLKESIIKNKKTIWIAVGVIVALVVAWMIYVYWRRKLKPEIISASPKSSGDEQAFNDMVALIKSDNGHPCSQTDELNKILVVAGNNYTTGTVNSSYGNSKTGALLDAVDKRRTQYYLEHSRPGGGIGGYMSSSIYDQLTTRWQQYKTAEPV